MVTLSPRFTFLATLCALAALSSAPISDAAVLRLRALDPSLTNMASGHSHAGAATWFPRHSSYAVDNSPILPLPKTSGKSFKNSADSGDSRSGLDNKDDQKSPSTGGSHGEKDVSAGDRNKDSTYEYNDEVFKEGGKVKDRRWNSLHPLRGLSELWFGDNHVLYSRAPHHHHHHHHHDRYRRLRRSHEKVVVSGDHDHVRVGSSSHHHHHHNGFEKVEVSGNHDHVRVGRSPRPHRDYHHHSGSTKVIGDHEHVRVDRSDSGEEVVFSRDNDHVHRQRSVFIAGEQGHSYVVPRVAKRSATQEPFTFGKRAAGGLDGAPGHIDIMSPSDGVSGGERLASLVLAPSTSAMSDSSASPSSAFVLNASNMDGTQMLLIPSSSSFSKFMLNTHEMVVSLRLPMFNAASASIDPYCVTYNHDPPAPAPLTAERCTEDPVGELQSQVFAFDSGTGVLRPMWFKTQESESDGCVDGVNRAAAQNASLPSVTGVDSSHSDPTSSANPASASSFAVLTAVDSSHMASPDESEGSIQGTQNVALVFVATNPEVMDTPTDASTTGSSVLGTTTTAMESSAPGSPAAQVTSSSSSPVSASTVSSASSNTSVAPSGTLASVPSSTTTPVSGTVSTSSMVLGVQVVPESASQVVSTTSSSATPTIGPLNTQPYEWMFSLDP